MEESESNVILANVSEILIVSESHHYLAMPSPKDVSSCKQLHSNYYCDPQDIVLATFRPTCEWDIVSNNPKLDLCAFSETEMEEPVFEGIGLFLFAYFPQATPAMVQCPEEQPGGVTLIGRHRFTMDCTLTTPGISYLGKRISHGHNLDLGPRQLPALKWEEISQQQVRKIAKIGGTLSPEQVDPVELEGPVRGVSPYTIGVLVSLGVVVMFLVALGCFTFAQRGKFTALAMELATVKAAKTTLPLRHVATNKN